MILTKNESKKEDKNKNFQLEKKHLEDTLYYLRKRIDEINKEIQLFKKEIKDLRYEHDSESDRDLMLSNISIESKKNKIEKYSDAYKSPYFARMDYKYDNDLLYTSLYMGNIGYDEQSIYGVIDWRSDFGEVFYQCQNGHTTYNNKSVYVKLKRNFKITNNKLINFNDVEYDEYIAKKIKKLDPSEVVTSKTIIEDANINKHVSEDLMLKEILEKNANKKLKDIIQTIRQEQDEIIRQPLDKTLIIQGVAGSGKSSIGLHRISYLLYNYRKENLKPEEILVVAPNDIFLDYISELLPDIDASGVKQFTFEALAASIIKRELKITSDEKMQFLCNNLDSNLNHFLKDAVKEISSFKGSLMLKDLLDNYINNIMWNIKREITDINYMSGKILITKDEQLRLLNNNRPFNIKIKELKEYLERKVQFYLQKRNILGIGLFSTEQKHQIMKSFNNYINIFKTIDPIQLYKDFYKDIDIKTKFVKEKYFSFISEYTIQMISNGEYEREDIAPICYLYILIEGIDINNKYRHIFVDEAQDLSPFEYVVLREISLNDSMTIMGDLNQGIFMHRGLKNWDELIKQVYKDRNIIYREILNSYRSTMEIVNFSNKLLPIGFKKGIPIDYHSEEPKIIMADNIKEEIQYVIKYIKLYKEKGCSTFGILAKSLDECSYLQQCLEKYGIKDYTLISSEKEKYNGGISIIPISLSKGLEFDCCIIFGASDKNFKNNDLDRNLLYVAVTRPLKYLCILHIGKLTPLLKH